MYTRRKFISVAGGGLLGVSLLGKAQQVLAADTFRKLVPVGPGSKYVPRIKVTFVRRKGEYGILWPGQIYDGRTTYENYTRLIKTTAADLGMEIDLRPEPIYSTEEADKWVAEAQTQKPDGLLVVVHDRQQHAWPTAVKAASIGIPTVIFSPVGTAFTTNTEPLARKDGVYISSSDDFSKVAWGLKMLKAGARLREMRFIVIAGDERKESRLDILGTRLRYLPARSFLEEYNKTPENEEVKAIAADIIKHAAKMDGPTTQDVLNGVKSFVVARNILEREEGDGITMDCLGALGPTNVSLPCISWSRMNDAGIPAACEADLGACVTHALVQLLFDRPGFQQDPVPETAKDCLIGSHCCCPTRLGGFDEEPETYSIQNHHGKRDATVVPVWKSGQRMTSADVLLNQDNVEMIISSGTVVQNIAVPPSGGCVVAVMVKLDGVNELLDYPGFHQIFFYGDYKKELKNYCQLFGIRQRVI